jgi:hypothetical protein
MGENGNQSSWEHLQVEANLQGKGVLAASKKYLSWNSDKPIKKGGKKVEKVTYPIDASCSCRGFFHSLACCL